MIDRLPLSQHGTKKQRQRADDLIEAILEIEPGVEQMPRIVALFDKKGDRDVFWLLDEKPGQFYPSSGWHSKLRCVRNHPVHGPQLFAQFRKHG